ESAMEAGDASGTGLFDVRQRKFDDASLSAFDALLANSTDAGLASRLPRLQAVESPQSALGSVTASAAEQFGLAPGTLVSRGGGDNMMSAIGSGATQPGVTTLSLGTSGTVFAYSDSPVVDPEGLIAPFCGSAGGWLPLLCVMNLTGVTEEVRAGFKQDHETLTACAREVEPGCDGLLWIPYLNGERVPDLPNATGTLLGMRPGNLRAGTMYRAALEGTSMNLAWGVERLRALGVPTTELRLVGGAANNSLWREIIANCLNASVTQLAEAESAALGAALQALWSWHHETGTPVALEELSASCVQTLGEITPADQELSARYATLATRFRQEALRV
ncbi:MAG: xylulokinase, partial [Candidatus Paceibacteria bacterium]